jgi:hypothetical protein
MTEFTTEEIATIREVVWSDTPLGYEWFYRLTQNRVLPDHCKPWIKQIYASHAAGRGTLIRAFVGSTKTTVITDVFTAYRIGLEPKKRNMLIQASDDSASNNAQFIAGLIESNPGWKICFPHLVPDIAKGWSRKGYEVMPTNSDYGEFRQGVAQDPCWQGMGYTSSGIIGRHPDGCMIIDDINDENNTRSDREREHTNDILRKTIMGRNVAGQTWLVGVGTPWRRDDALGYMEGTGLFDCITSPVMDEEGVPAWPEKMSLENIDFQRKALGSVGFSLMYMLNLDAAEGGELKREWLHQYPYDKINSTWPVVMGVDYASVRDPRKGKDGDNFAIAVGRMIPGGGLVVVDGYFGRISQSEAEAKILQFYDIYPACKMIKIEDLGKGEEFYASFIRNHSLPVDSSKVGNKSKGERFTREIAPLFQRGSLWVSDASNEFLNQFTREWCAWEPHGIEHDDTIDAVYHMIKAGIENLPPDQHEVFYAPAYRKQRINPMCGWSQA